jgi:hypothetical protein
MARKKDCLINIELAHWEKLKFYWSDLRDQKEGGTNVQHQEQNEEYGQCGAIGQSREKNKANTY